MSENKSEEIKSGKTWLTYAEFGHLLSWINLLETTYQNCTAAITDFLCADDASTRRQLINQLTDAPPVWADRPHDLIADLYAAVQRREEDGR